MVLPLLRNIGPGRKWSPNRKAAYRFQGKILNNVTECDQDKLKRIINATLRMKSMKTAYATIRESKDRRKTFTFSIP